MDIESKKGSLKLERK